MQHHVCTEIAALCASTVTEIVCLCRSVVVCLQWCCWLGGRKGIRSVKELSGGVLAWLSVWSEVQTCIWPSGCHCHSLSLASVKSRLVFPFWYRLTRVVRDKGLSNVCVRVCNAVIVCAVAAAMICCHSTRGSSLHYIRACQALPLTSPSCSRLTSDTTSVTNQFVMSVL